MLLSTIIALTLLAVVNYRLGGKALLYPPVVFCGIWAFDLFLLWLSQDFFYPVLPETLLVFLCGGLLFSIGCWIALLVAEQKFWPKPVLQPSSDRIISILVSIVILGTPLYYRWLSTLAAEYSGVPFLLAVRARMLEIAGKSTAYTVFGTFLDFSMILALLAFLEKERHSKRAAVAVVLAFFMSMLLGKKDGVLTVAVTLLAVDWMMIRRLRWKLVLVMVLIMVIGATAVFYYVSFGGDPIQGKVAGVIELFALYASGSMVGFDRVVREPNIVPQANPLYVYYLRIARRFGAHVDVPEVWGYVSVGPHSFVDNAYTMYFSYLDGGYLGTILVAGAIGFFTTLIYTRALHGRPTAILLYAFLFRDIVFSTFTEYFFSTLYFMLKVWLICWVVYSLPARWVRFKRNASGVIQAELVKSQ